MKNKLVSQLLYDAEQDCFVLDGEPLHNGDALEVLVCNGLHGDRPEWIETRLENYDGVWSLAGILGCQVSGLFARK